MSVSLCSTDSSSTKRKLSVKAQAKQSKCIIDDDGNVKPFSEIKTSTCTVIVITNCKVDLASMFELCPITDYTPIIKRRGRKKRNNFEKPTTKLPFGSVIRVQHELKVRGAEIKKDEDKKIDPEQPRDPKANKKAYFLHCVTMVVVVDEAEEKTKNVKIYSNGKLQITGCKNQEQAINTVKAVFNVFDTIQRHTGQSVVEMESNNYKAVFNIVMQNMDFFMGFNIFRNRLDQFINKIKDFEIKSIFENSMNTCVNIKIPIESKDEKLMCIEYDRNSSNYTTSYVNRDDYKKHINKKNSKKEDEHTFLVFASGHVIFTSSPGPNMEQTFYKIINMLVKNREHFEIDTQRSKEDQREFDYVKQDQSDCEFDEDSDDSTSSKRMKMSSDSE